MIGTKVFWVSTSSGLATLRYGTIKGELSIKSYLVSGGWVVDKDSIYESLEEALIEFTKVCKSEIERIESNEQGNTN